MLFYKRTYLLQSQDLRVDQEKKPYIRVNIRELNGVPSTGMSTLYMLDYWFIH